MTSNPFRIAEAVFILWKPRVGRITRLSTVIRLNDIVQVFRGPVLDILRQQTFVRAHRCHLLRG